MALCRLQLLNTLPRALQRPTTNIIGWLCCKFAQTKCNLFSPCCSHLLLKGCTAERPSQVFYAKLLSQMASAIIECLAQAFRRQSEIINQLADGLAQPACNYFPLCQKTFLIFKIISELLAHPVWKQLISESSMEGRYVAFQITVKTAFCT